ncbi:MAG: aminotransferase class V-fold PLP-dependent enzyme [Puniceicoccales bacterium]|jgi:cysteine desulfurase|nr:aminotransferase class V-fold PLP-dependent enzyme [Puniceicoccales bacterium]
MLYFDANATTPLHPSARAAWLHAQDVAWGNTSAPSAPGVRAHALLEDCRSRLTARLPAGMRVVFSSGATEGNNAVLSHAARNAGRAGGAFAAVSALEHASVAVPAAALFPKPPLVIPATPEGVVDIFAAEALLRDIAAKAQPLPALFSLMAVNNETGVLQPVQAARALASRHGIPLHCDASQAFGKLAPEQLLEMLAGCDFVTGCAHKFGGPKGVGFLAFNPDAHPGFTMQAGGGQENHRRAGTPDVAGVAAMLAALEATDADFVPATDGTGDGGGAPKVEAMSAARLRFEERIRAEIHGSFINGAAAGRVWNTVSLVLPAHGNLRWLKQLERRGFVAAAGPACASGEGGLPSVSRVLLAIGLSPAEARRTLRLSAWRDMPAGGWDDLANALVEVHGALGPAESF